MELSHREIWSLLHGIVPGFIFLLSYAGTMIWLISLNDQLLTPEGKRIRNRLVQPAVWLLCIICWLTVISGTFMIYPWYRAVPPEGAMLTHYPQALLKSSPSTQGWHYFAMEWKEHIAWLSPMLFTVIAYLATFQHDYLADSKPLRRVLMILLNIAFAGDVLNNIKNEELRENLMNLAVEKLRKNEY